MRIGSYTEVLPNFSLYVSRNINIQSQTILHKSFQKAGLVLIIITVDYNTNNDNNENVKRVVWLNIFVETAFIWNKNLYNRI